MVRVIVLVGVAVCGVVVACAPRVVRTSRSMPADVQLGLLKLPRIWVAGFVASGRPEFDLSFETVRLLRRQLRNWSASVVEAEPIVVDSTTRLSDVAYWRRLGEEHGGPLIVTGTVRWLFAPAKIEERGKRRIYLVNGRVFEATVVLIDGHSGKAVSTEPLPSRMRYDTGPKAFALTLFYEMMEQELPDWFRAIAEPISQQSPGPAE